MRASAPVCPLLISALGQKATTAIRQAEVLAAKCMIERSMERFGLCPARLMGDSAHGSADMLGWLVHEHGIEPHVTVFDKSARKDGTFSRGDFTYDHEHDVYVCPGGQKCRARSTKVLAIWPARSRSLGKATPLGDCAKRSRCCSHTSSAFSTSAVFDYEGRTVRVMSFSSQQPPPEPSEIGETDTDTKPETGLRANRRQSSLQSRGAIHIVLLRDFFNGIGQERTYAPQQVMSALPPITTAKADSRKGDVCFTPKSGHLQCISQCQLWAMCGRLPVGKNFLHVAALVGAAMCSAC